MPRSPTFPYTYALPAGTAAVSGAVISSTAYNNFTTDLQTVLNETQPINLGGTGATTALGAWDAINIQSADVPTATSLNLDASGPYLNLTGTTAVTGITLAQGHQRSARAVGIFQLTANANLVVNGSTSVNYTTTANTFLHITGGAAGVTYVWVIQNPASLAGYLQAGVTSLITVGYTVTPFSIGTVSSGTTTLAGANGQTQYLTNNGAFTLAAPAADTEIDLLVTNGASAGAITFSGFTVGSITGSALTTTNTNKFLISVRRINSVATYSIYALQ